MVSSLELAIKNKDIRALMLAIEDGYDGGWTKNASLAREELIRLAEIGALTETHLDCIVGIKMSHPERGLQWVYADGTSLKHAYKRLAANAARYKLTGKMTGTGTSMIGEEKT